MKKKYFELGNSQNSVLGNKIKNNNYDFEYSKEGFDINCKIDSHAAIARNIIEKSVVLDVGCASGKMGQILYDFKNCIIDGIEYDKESIKAAKESNKFRNLFCFSISNNNDKEFINFFSQKNLYDYIIFGDVLEHLIDPYKALKEFSKLLKKNGSILISLPNIAYIDTIIGLLNGDFNYNNQGILDSTHLRFFTKNSFIDLLRNLALNDNIYFNAKLTDRILVKPPYIENDEMYELFNLNGNINDFYTLQNVFILEKTNKENWNLQKTNSKSYFDIISKKYIDLKIKEKELEKVNLKLIQAKNDYEDLESKYNNLIIEKQKLNNYLNSITNSKRWKFINKLFNYKNIFKK